MTWKSHIAIATAVTIPFNPMGIPFAILGSTAPDWSEWILKLFGHHVEHRGATHYLIVPLAIIGLSFIIDYHNFLFWFGIGYLTHWFADSLTVSGVPLSPNAKHRIHFFGGKFRTGDPIEYGISFGLLLVVLLIVKPDLDQIEEEYRYNPYFTEYGKLYDKRIIDEKEYHDKRFRF